MESLKPQTIEESIYATVAYFDLFDYPLTQHELWIFLMYTPNESESVFIENVIEMSSKIEELEWKKGFVCLRGRSDIIQTRLARYLFAERKTQKALRFGRVCAMVPGVSMIALCNTLAFSHSRDNSDIDLFIVAKNGYLWFVRAACVVISLFFGKRPSQSHMRDTLCLSFFVSEEALDLFDLALPSKEGVDDIYLAIWVSRCIPLFNENNCYEQFWKANKWSEKIVSHRMPYVPNHMRRIILNQPQKILKHFLTMLGRPLQSSLEKMLELVQRQKFPKDIQRAMLIGGSEVVVNDGMLKFHLIDRRAEFRDALIKKIHSYRHKKYDTA